ncbi:hypothetical protein BGZ83_008040 [Gryganskiella cystojenkinii]|nr:hypothetical protein BGZ83_008040 [Gryganskiella cystojenkinii]
MISSAKTLAPFFANDQELFLRELIPTRSELSNKLDSAIKNVGKDKRQRLRVLLDFDGAVTIQSSQLSSETKSFSDIPIVVVLDTQPTSKDNIYLQHKTTEREVYNAARKRLGIKKLLADMLLLCNALLTVSCYFSLCTDLGPITAPIDASTPFDVILYNEENQIMEASIANIAIELENPATSKLEWITPPASSGLLCGTMRRKLLEEGKIHERVITVDELKEAARQEDKVLQFRSQGVPSDFEDLIDRHVQ